MSSFNQKGIVHILVVVLLLAGVILGIYLVKNPTAFTPHASSSRLTFSIDGFSAAYGFSKGNRLYNSKYDADSNGIINSSDKDLLINQFKAITSKMWPVTLKGKIVVQISDPEKEGPAIESLFFKTVRQD